MADSAPPKARSTAGLLLLLQDRWLASVVALGLVVRLLLVFGRIDVLHPDEIFQYTEQAHRLVFGSGVVPWEFVIGVRSWLLPLLIALLLKVSSLISDDPLLYVQFLRLLAAGLSLSVVIVGYRFANRAAGQGWAVVTGLFCAIWYQALFFSVSFVGEVLSAFLILVAILLVEERKHEDARGTFALGALLGLAFCLRFHTAPALFLVGCWHCRLSWRERWLPLVLGGLAVVVPVLGALDFLMLGTPFQSIWLNYDLNVVEGVSNFFGREPFYQYFLLLAWPDNLWSIPLIAAVIAGSFRNPLLALAALVTVVEHAFIPHKEFRFIAFAAMAVPILAGLGFATAGSLLAQRAGERWRDVATVSATLYIAALSWFGWAGEHGRYPNDSVLQAFLAAHDAPDICGLGVGGMHWAMSGGYTFLHRDVPLYITYAEPAPKVVLEGRLLPVYPQRALFSHPEAFNYLIMPGAQALPGYAVQACFPSETGGQPACLMRRAGGCS